MSDPSDCFEREAVSNADRVMSAPAGPAVQRCEDHGAADSTVQREEALPAEEGEEEKMAQTFVQREEEEEIA